MLGLISPEINNIENFAGTVAGGGEDEEIIPAREGYFFTILQMMFIVSAEELALALYHTEDSSENYIIPSQWGALSGYGGPYVYKLPVNTALLLTNPTADFSYTISGYYSKK